MAILSEASKQLERATTIPIRGVGCKLLAVEAVGT